MRIDPQANARAERFHIRRRLGDGESRTFKGYWLTSAPSIGEPLKKKDTERMSLLSSPTVRSFEVLFAALRSSPLTILSVFSRSYKVSSPSLGPMRFVKVLDKERIA